MSEMQWRTHRLEPDDQTLREWDAAVLAADAEGIVLDRSAFYPGGGGQPPDHGVLLWGGVQTQIVGARKGDDLYLIPAEGDPLPPPGTAVVLLDDYGEIEYSSLDAGRWLAEHFGPAEHAGWLPGTVAAWLALPPRPALISVRDGRRLTVHLLPGDPHTLLLQEEVASFRPDALDRLGLTPRETEVLYAAVAIKEEADIASELCLSLHAVRDRLAHLGAKLGVHTTAEAVIRARREST